jgi:hypothetical protein
VQISIELDNQLCFETDKVCDIGPNRLLPTKFISAEPPVPQSGPKPAFSICLFAPKPASEFMLHCSLSFARIRANPSPALQLLRHLALHTSPTRGEEKFRILHIF